MPADSATTPTPTSTSASLAPWLEALHTNSGRLAALVGGLSEAELFRPSFADGWSIAHVLSHLGSAAEISAGLLQRGLAGDTTGPRREEVAPVWERWDALSAPAQREAWTAADAHHLFLLDSLDEQASVEVRVPYFAGLLGVSEYAGYRLSEQSVHAWDIEVALDPAATVPPAEVRLLWERLDVVATRFRDAETLQRLGPRQLSVRLTDADRTLLLDLDSELHLYPCEPAEPAGILAGPAEAVLRLFYGRLRQGDGVTATGHVTLADLQALFPGF
ncbi:MULTISPECIES: maleylpyruvate isomerase N-terminal domain-containing protein [unclassified Streptomyces]|uniref:maleylpyruvate isomerase N-terminal domain-containing protein n=1 Tax=unclassified Streptomyces TaxID=2593676 RepID=UPI0029B6C9F2|nr:MULTISPECIES: maleylpyruvate isomerase N-terminal domain-containing protein [unclassified Streptomyces]MDX3771984.1 maleylpyruvate isomerase N-terminal domain-containing protein [Streptomyces sp. AK08-01B]MDX3821471.1 maleylpyruvate isomerase N-terminal domain-containing protein [Streptomyces sp. AK08-01A]